MALAAACTRIRWCPTVGEPNQGSLLKPGMTLALEPMINMGGWPVEVKPNGWTVVTRTAGLSAHFEHTVAITDGEAEILTKLVISASGCCGDGAEKGRAVLLRLRCRV